MGRAGIGVMTPAGVAIDYACWIENFEFWFVEVAIHTVILLFEVFEAGMAAIWAFDCFGNTHRPPHLVSPF